MPAEHWEGYVEYIKGVLETPGAKDFWNDVGAGFSRDFRIWVDSLVSESEQQTEGEKPKVTVRG